MLLFSFLLAGCLLQSSESLHAQFGRIHHVKLCSLLKGIPVTHRHFVPQRLHSSAVQLPADSTAHEMNDKLDLLNFRVEDGGLGSGLLLACTVLSIALANSPCAVRWLSVWNNPIGVVRLGSHALCLKSLINEGLMALFFFKVGLEIKAELVNGSLSSIRSALLPCIAAVGGMIAPMLVYALVQKFSGASGSMAGLTVPMATDIAFAMGVYKAFGAHLPSAMSTFLLTLATVDDLGAIAVIATCFAANVNRAFLAGGAVLQVSSIHLSKPIVSRFCFPCPTLEPSR